MEAKQLAPVLRADWLCKLFWTFLYQDPCDPALYRVLCWSLLSLWALISGEVPNPAVRFRFCLIGDLTTPDGNRTPLDFILTSFLAAGAAARLSRESSICHIRVAVFLTCPRNNNVAEPL